LVKVATDSTTFFGVTTEEKRKKNISFYGKCKPICFNAASVCIVYVYTFFDLTYFISILGKIMINLQQKRRRTPTKNYNKTQNNN